MECNPLLDELPTVSETMKAIELLSSGKAPGSDAILAEIYKAGGPPVAEKLSYFTLCGEKKPFLKNSRMQQLSTYSKGKGILKKGKRKVQGVLESQTAALPRPQEEEETDKSKQAQIEQTYEKH